MRRAPKSLGEEGKKTWKECLSFLEKNGMSEDVDYPLLLSYCAATDFVIQCMQDIKDNGVKVEHTNKAGESNIVNNPAITALKHFYDIIERGSKKFGFNPLDRSKMELQAEDVDPLADLLKDTKVNIA